MSFGQFFGLTRQDANWYKARGSRHADVSTHLRAAKKRGAAGSCAGTPLNAISRSNWNPRVSRSEAAVQKRLVRMVPGSAQNWMPVNAVQQSNLNKQMKIKNMTTLQLRNSLNRSPWRCGVFLLPLALACFGLLPAVQAVQPPPDGGYLGFNTAEGHDALFSLTNGGFNTAIGVRALYGDTTGIGNTAVGAFALMTNSAGDWNVAVGRGALQNNTGSGNVAVGSSALVNNQNAGNSSQAFGLGALFHQTTGLYNNGFGAGTLYSNVSGANNTAIGHRAGFHITGNGNVD